MKTTKFFLIVALLSFATLNISQAISEHHKNVIEIRLKAAMENPRLVKVMQDQLNPKFLDPSVNYDHLFYAKVKYFRITYVVFGTYSEWINFFEMNTGTPPPIK